MSEIVPDHPAAWLTENVRLIPSGGLVLDVACGRGRNALYLAGSGFKVHAIDRREEAIRDLEAKAESMGVVVAAQVMDLESGRPAIESARYDGVVVINYLHRPLLPILIEALVPGGVLVYETFTVGQALRGHPRNPDFLLRDGELQELAKPLEILRWREGEVEGKLVASIVARRS